MFTNFAYLFVCAPSTGSHWLGDVIYPQGWKCSQALGETSRLIASSTVSMSPRCLNNLSKPTCPELSSGAFSAHPTKSCVPAVFIIILYLTSWAQPFLHGTLTHRSGVAYNNQGGGAGYVYCYWGVRECYDFATNIPVGFHSFTLLGVCASATLPLLLHTPIIPCLWILAFPAPSSWRIPT